MSNARSLAAAPALNALVPAGVYLPFGGATAPTGWLSCDGSAVSRTTYAALFAAIGTAYGTGDGSTTFNLPNMANRIPVGSGGGKTRGTTGGSATVTPSGSVDNTTLSAAQMPTHNHGSQNPNHYETFFYSPAGVASYGGISGGGIVGGAYQATSGSSGAHNHGLTMGSVSVEQPWTCCHYIIKY